MRKHFIQPWGCFCTCSAAVRCSAWYSGRFKWRQWHKIKLLACSGLRRLFWREELSCCILHDVKQHKQESLPAILALGSTNTLLNVHSNFLQPLCSLCWFLNIPTHVARSLPVLEGCCGCGASPHISVGFYAKIPPPTSFWQVSGSACIAEADSWERQLKVTLCSLIMSIPKRWPVRKANELLMVKVHFSCN